jgi:Tol biopolymer transport system component
MAPAIPIHLRPGGRQLSLRLAAIAALILASAGLPGPAHATFAGRDGLVAVSHFEQSGDQFRVSLFTMNPDGTARLRVTTPDWGFADVAPNWSPDGRAIAFERDNPDGFSEIYVVNADGSGLTKITNCVGQRTGATPFDWCGGYFGPVWTPDGRSIVVTRCCIHLPDADHQTIDIMNADGTGLRQVTFDAAAGGGDQDATVSPDGNWIAFSRVVGEPTGNAKGSAMFLVHPDGTGLHQVTSFGLWVDEKDWSPDGSRIVFVTHAQINGKTKPFRADIDTIRPDGTGLTQLSATVPGQTFAFSPQWSPAGDRIMFDFYPGPDGQTNVYTMRPDGTDVTIVPGTSNDNPTDWGSAPTR